MYKLTIFFLTLSLMAFGKTVELEFKGRYQKGRLDKKVSSKIIAKLGQEFIVPAESGNPFKFRMTVDETKTGAIVVKGVIYDLDDKIVSSAKLITKYGQEAKIVKSKKGEVFTLAVLPEKI